MKRLLAIVMLYALPVLAGPDLLTPEERVWLDQHAPLRYAPDPAFPPFEYFDSEGRLAGITPELLSLVASNLGTRIEVVRLPTWSEVLVAIQDGRADLIGSVVKTPERETYLLFTRPYGEVPYGLFVGKDMPRDTTLKQLYAARVGVVRNYGAHAWLTQHHPGLPSIPVETTREGLLLVAVGQLDAMLETLPVGRQVIEDLSLFNLTHLPQVLYTTPQHLAVSIRQPILLGILQKGLNSIPPARRAVIMDQVTGYGREPGPREFPPWVRHSLLALLAGLLVLLIWVLSLRRMVTLRTRALRNSEDRYRTLLENLPQMIFLKDCQYLYVSCNEHYARLLGIKPEQIVGKTDFDFFPPELARQYRQHDEEVLRTRTVHERDEAFEVEGRRTYNHIVKTPVYDQAGRLQGVLGVFWDITDQRRSEEARVELEQQLRQAQKMEAVGRLAGGVAHDFNNILTVILGNANLLADDPGLNREAQGLVRDIVQAAGRAASLTRQLLTFGRRQVARTQPVDLNSVVERLRSMLAPLLGETHELEVNLGPGLPLVLADESMMEQVVMNLVLNARDAMPGGGRIQVFTREQALTSSYQHAGQIYAAGPYVVLDVMDQGMGMDEETQSHIFEPFFTTKEVGKGTGLGLPTVYGIAEQHKGWIEVESAVGQGSRFRVFLPALVRGPDRPVEVAPDTPGGMPRGSEFILVVEDEVPLRRMTCEALQRLGYRVLEADNGAEALNLWPAVGSGIHLLLTDVVMPGGVSGLDLAKRLREQTPQLRVIFSSGYSEEMVSKRSDIPVGATFLSKPYDVRTLATTVRACLDQPGS